MKNLKTKILAAVMMLTLPYITNEIPLRDTSKIYHVSQPYPWEKYRDYKFTEELDLAQLQVKESMKGLEGKTVPKRFRNCWEIANSIYEKAKVNFSCIYSDAPLKKYDTKFGKIIIGKKGYIVPGKGHPSCKNISEEEKLGLIQFGDLIAYVNGPYIGHNVIFNRWIDKETGEAEVYDGSNREYGKRKVNLSKKSNPVFIIWKPVSR